VKVAEFLENFRYVAEAPNGVRKLRELVLSLAMKGALVPQNENEASAKQLIRQVEEERRAAYSQVQNRPPKQQRGLTATDIPYPIPETWQWVTFGSIAHHNAGKTLDKARNSGHPRKYITTSNLYWGRFDLNDVREMLIRDDELDRCTARRGDLLICEGGEAGRAAVWDSDEEICFQNHIHRARLLGGVDPYYCFRYFQKLEATGEINEYRKGVGISNLSGKALSSIPFPLGPVAEQKRIVAKVDELMALCDKLEAQQSEKAERIAVLSLVQHEDFVRSPAGWVSTQRFKSAPFMEPSQIQQSIRTLAVTGLLSSKQASDMSVRALLHGIAEERAALIQRGEIKRTKRKDISDREVLSSRVPNHWKLVRLEDLCRGISDGVHKKPNYRPTGVPFVTVRNLTKGPGISFDDLNYISEHDHREFIKRTRPEKGDILITKDGTIGVVRLIDTEREFSIFVSVALIKPIDTRMSSYLVLALESAFVQDQIAPKGAALKHLHLIDLRSLLIPVPPLEEQERIVAQVVELIAQADMLEAQRLRRDAIADDFAQAAVAAIAGTASKESKPMKAPETELVTRLEIAARATKPGSNEPLASLLARQNGPLSAKELWQRSGLAIEAFYQQLKTEQAAGWIIEPEPARMREIKAD
jgi:type I restriction enzyme S subunit